MSARLRWLLLPLLLLPACGDEQPLDVGSALLPEDALRSFEITLEAEQFLLLDTAFAIFGTSATEYQLLARDYGGVLNAHEFVRYQVPPAISIVDSAGRTRTDSAYRVVRGEVQFVVDTVATPIAPGMVVALHAFAEDWEPTEADWDFRAKDTPWTTPGGTVGALLSTVQVTRDSVFLAVDSAIVRQWADTANHRRGARLSLVEGPARIRSAAHPRLRIHATSTHHPDTTFTVDVAPHVARFAYRPLPGTQAAEPRVAGNPTWRTFMQLRPDLGELVVSCGTGCTIPLKDAAITRAELVLQPRPAPPGFDPELSVRATASEALVAPAFPLPRTPLGATVGTFYTAVEPERFRTSGAPALMLITEFIRQLVANNQAGGSPFAGTGWLALQHTGEQPVFGIGTFEPGPRLRLVLSTARQIQLP